MHPTKKVAEITSRIMTFFLVFALLFPTVTGYISNFPGWSFGSSYPDIINYDELLGIPSLPLRTIAGIVGVAMMLIGFGFMSISVVVLLDRGQGLPAFVLSKKLASKDIYKYTRNPMSFGFYLMCIALGLLAGSSFFTLWSLFVVIPAHITFLKYFEERELEVRFGQPYKEYKQRVPFLIPKFGKVSEIESANNND